MTAHFPKQERREQSARATDRPALDVPTEVHLGTRDPIAVKHEDLGVAPSASVAPRHLVRHDHFVPSPYQPNEFELLSLSGARPAALETAHAIQLNIDWTREPEIVGQDALHDVAVARCEGKVEILREFDPAA
jgi:hypothetical protein